MDDALARKVRERAGYVCEHGRTPEACYPTVPFPVDHIIARQHGGLTTIGTWPCQKSVLELLNKFRSHPTFVLDLRPYNEGRPTVATAAHRAAV